MHNLFTKPEYKIICGHKIAFYRRGMPQRNATVFLHGYMTWSFTWRNVLRHLVDNHGLRDTDYVLLIDLPGHGNSKTIAKQTHWNGHYVAGLLEKLFVELELDSINLVGTQMGGSIAAFYLCDFSTRVSNAVIMSAGALGEAKSNMLLFRLLQNPLSGPLIRSLMSRTKFRDKWLAAHGSQYNEEESIIDDYYSHFKSMATLMTTVALGVRKSYGVDFRELEEPLKQCSVPTRLIWGEDDDVVPMEVGEKFSQCLITNELIKLPGVSDFPQEEAPALVAKHISDFLFIDAKN